MAVFLFGSTIIRVAIHVAVHESASGPSRHLARRSEMSGVEVKADSKSMASFGRFLPQADIGGQHHMGR